MLCFSDCCYWIATCPDPRPPSSCLTAACPDLSSTFLFYLSIIRFCLICVLTSVCLIKLLIMLQMDPSLSDESLQKTSLPHDPAAIYLLSSELSSQAMQLAIHHRQLQKRITLTEELVKTLQTLQVSPPELSLPQANPTMAAASAPPPSVSPCLAFPEKYDGNPSQCKGFLLQCTLFVNQQSALYSTE